VRSLVVCQSFHGYIEVTISPFGETIRSDFDLRAGSNRHVVREGAGGAVRHVLHVGHDLGSACPHIACAIFLQLDAWMLRRPSGSGLTTALMQNAPTSHTFTS
jgi:hypothetical protein